PGHWLDSEECREPARLPGHARHFSRGYDGGDRGEFAGGPTVRATGPPRTHQSRPMKLIFRNRAGTIGFVIFAAIVITAFVGPFFVPQTLATDVKAIYQGPSWQHLLGTDSEGRDI